MMRPGEAVFALVGAMVVVGAAAFTAFALYVAVRYWMGWRP